MRLRFGFLSQLSSCLYLFLSFSCFSFPCLCLPPCSSLENLFGLCVCRANEVGSLATAAAAGASHTSYTLHCVYIRRWEVFLRTKIPCVRVHICDEKRKKRKENVMRLAGINARGSPPIRHPNPCLFFFFVLLSLSPLLNKGNGSALGLCMRQ